MIDIKAHLPVIGVAVLLIALFFLLRGQLSALEDRVNKQAAAANKQGFAPLASEPACSPAGTPDSDLLGDSPSQGEDEAAAALLPEDADSDEDDGGADE